jgi:hypothetical protein
MNESEGNIESWEDVRNQQYYGEDSLDKFKQDMREGILPSFKLMPVRSVPAKKSRRGARFGKYWKVIEEINNHKARRFKLDIAFPENITYGDVESFAMGLRGSISRAKLGLKVSIRGFDIYVEKTK